MKTEELKQNVKGYVHQFEDGGLRLLRKGQKGVIHAIFSRFGLVLILLLHEKRRERPAPKVDAPKPAGETVWRSFALLFSNIAFWTILFYFASSSLPN